MPKKTWWSKGVRFQCQGSGKCCISRGQVGFVYLTRQDILRFSRYFSQTAAEFKKMYCDTTSGHVHLRETPERAECQFLKNKRCDVYESRPTQCRTWPFWPEMMNSKKWNKEVAPFCPGVGKGPIVPAKKIEENLRSQSLADKD